MVRLRSAAVITAYRREGRARLAVTLGEFRSVRARTTPIAGGRGNWRPALVRTWACRFCDYSAVIAGTDEAAMAAADAHRDRDHRRPR